MSIRKTLEEAGMISKSEEYTCKSGGAKGYDTKWNQECSKKGIKVIDYSFKGHKSNSKNLQILTEEELEAADKHCERACESLKRWFPKHKPWIANLLRRNWYQVKSSEAIYAIAQIDFVKNIVSGGTGWACQMGIDNNKHVFVFDHEIKRWFYYDYPASKFSVLPTEFPPIFKTFAGVGSRETNLSGLSAIEEFLTFHFRKDGDESLKELRYDLPFNPTT